MKRLYENAGWRWSPTRFADEPRPARRAAAVAAPKSSTVEPTRSLDELRAIATGFTIADLELSFDAFKVAVRERRQPATAFDFDRLTFEIRGALRELKKF